MTVARILAAKGKDVVTTQPHRTLAEAAALLTARNIGAAVVTDAQGRVLGMLSERDILHAVGKGGAAASRQCRFKAYDGAGRDNARGRMR